MFLVDLHSTICGRQLLGGDAQQLAWRVSGRHFVRASKTQLLHPTHARGVVHGVVEHDEQCSTYPRMPEAGREDVSDEIGERERRGGMPLVVLV